MGYDLLLSNTGDLSFIVSSSKFKEERFEFNFHIAPSDSLLYNFSVVNTSNKAPNVNDLVRPVREIITVSNIEEALDIKDPKVGMKIYITDKKATYKVISTYEEDSIVKINEMVPIQFSACLSYDFYAYTLQYDKINRVVNNNEFIQQAIKLRLNSDIGDIRGNESMGADLFKFMHVNTQKSRLLNQICDQVKASVSDILPNCTVSAYIINSNYLNYHDSIKIVIVNNEDIYYYYI